MTSLLTLIPSNISDMGVLDHISFSKLINPHQSAYKPGHSAKTAF